jgi:hypothetical protein
MLERRNSDRMALPKLSVREANGDYFFQYFAADLSEEGIYLQHRQLMSNQEPYSQLTFTLPNGKQIRNVTARIVREVRSGPKAGCGFEFLNLSEAHRMELKKYFHANLLKGTG